MKKVLSILLVAILAFSALPLVAYATGDPAFSLTSVSGDVGDSVDVVLSIDNNPGITNFDISVAFDTSALELTAKKANNKTVGKLTLSAATDMGSPQKVIFNDGTENVEDNGTLVTYTFKIKEGATTSDVTVSANKVSKLDNPELEDGKMTDIKSSFAYNKGTVTVNAAQPSSALEQAIAAPMTKAADDTFGDVDNFQGLEMLGVQQKTGANDIRFVTAVSKDVLTDGGVVDYGYVVTKSSKSKADAEAAIGNLTADVVKYSCMGTTCAAAGAYGDGSKDYSYVTFGVNNIPAGKCVLARFYVQTNYDTTYYYAVYDGTKAGIVYAV